VDETLSDAKAEKESIPEGYEICGGSVNEVMNIII
jgi:hypothetical protein